MATPSNAITEKSTSCYFTHIVFNKLFLYKVSNLLNTIGDGQCWVCCEEHVWLLPLRDKPHIGCLLFCQLTVISGGLVERPAESKKTVCLIQALVKCGQLQSHSEYTTQFIWFFFLEGGPSHIEHKSDSLHRDLYPLLYTHPTTPSIHQYLT